MIQVYTGNGKGKTTAGLGLAIRAAGAGLKVYIGQFIKKNESSELKILKRIKNITVEQFGSGCFIRGKVGRKDKKEALAGMRRVEEILAGGRYHVIILDEINVAAHFGLLKREDVIAFIKRVPENIELVLTGRCAHPSIIAVADLVSDIKDVKHYYKKGCKARLGIEL